MSVWCAMALAEWIYSKDIQCLRQEAKHQGGPSVPFVMHRSPVGTLAITNLVNSFTPNSPGIQLGWGGSVEVEKNPVLHIEQWECDLEP